VWQAGTGDRECRRHRHRRPGREAVAATVAPRHAANVVAWAPPTSAPSPSPTSSELPKLLPPDRSRPRRKDPVPARCLATPPGAASSPSSSSSVSRRLRGSRKTTSPPLAGGAWEQRGGRASPIHCAHTRSLVHGRHRCCRGRSAIKEDVEGCVPSSAARSRRLAAATEQQLQQEHQRCQLVAPFLFSATKGMQALRKGNACIATVKGCKEFASTLPPFTAPSMLVSGTIATS